MKITSLRKYKNGIFHPYSDSLRDTFYIEMKNVFLTGRNIHYPNTLVFDGQDLVNPYDERVMSLQKNTFYDNDEWELPQLTIQSVAETPYFFFHYNVDNYYHFIYDTLPILHSYFELKSKYPSLTLLMNTSHPSKNTFPPFVNEFLLALGIDTFEKGEENKLYKKLFVASSLTHGDKSKAPPSSLAFSVWHKLSVPENPTSPKRIYISRRSWIHGKTENIGTNYTTRRKCINEDQVVDLFKRYGFEEVFTELLSTEQKIQMFKNAESVAGIIGGGMSNLLFSPSSTKSLCITTPCFLQINERFQHSMNHTKIIYSDCADHTHKDWNFKPFTRVRVQGTSGSYDGSIGEVDSKVGNHYIITLSSNDVAGFSQDFTFHKKMFPEENLVPLDNGLNSPFEINLLQLEKDLKSLIENN